MAGIYIHIPYCKQKCSYCNFHFSISQKNKEALLHTLLLEIADRKNYLSTDSIGSIYFGGGTPSILESTEIEKIIQLIHQTFNVSKDAEISIETNPDDLYQSKLESYRAMGINRLSIGIQSFTDSHLQKMNRAHNAKESIECIRLAQKTGFDNISIDLIYGVPGMSLKDWQQEVATALSLNVQHISAYALTVEPKTLLSHQVEKKQILMPDQDLVSSHFLYLIERLKEKGFEQYEVSNFCKAGGHSKHNSSYWQSVPYIGIGPSAHSYDGKSRQWNVANNNTYINSFAENKQYFTIEKIDSTTAFNEYIMLGLRTKWGIDLDYIQEKFDYNIMKNNQSWYRTYEKYFESIPPTIILNNEGLLLADRIASDLMIV